MFPKSLHRFGKAKGQLQNKADSRSRTICPVCAKMNCHTTPSQSKGRVTTDDKVGSHIEPTERCASMVVVPKPGGKIIICVNLTKLNANVCWE